MRRKQQFTQSSKTTFGSCYGYSLVWSRGELDTNQVRKGELPLPKEVTNAQFYQQLPTKQTKSLPGLYMDWKSQQLAEGIKQQLVNDGDAVILKYHGFLFGHALAIKKISQGKYEFFDCGEGVYEFQENEFDKVYQNIEEKFYSRVFFCFSLEKIDSDKSVSHSLFENLCIGTYIFSYLMLTRPTIGLYRIASNFSYFSEMAQDTVAALSSDFTGPYSDDLFEDLEFNISP